MKILHFTQLKDHAVNTIERGRTYIECTPKVGVHEKDWYPMDDIDEEVGWCRPTAQASVILTASSLVQIRRADSLQLTDPSFHPVGADPYWDEKVLGFWQCVPESRFHKARRRWCYASDYGVVDGYGNYMLDRLTLLREGITVDLTRLDLLEPLNNQENS